MSAPSITRAELVAAVEAGIERAKTLTDAEAEALRQVARTAPRVGTNFPQTPECPGCPMTMAGLYEPSLRSGGRWRVHDTDTHAADWLDGSSRTGWEFVNGYDDALRDRERQLNWPLYFDIID